MPGSSQRLNGGPYEASIAPQNAPHIPAGLKQKPMIPKLKQDLGLVEERSGGGNTSWVFARFIPGSSPEYRQIDRDAPKFQKVASPVGSL